MKKQRLKLILVGLLLLFAIWMAWPETKSSGNPNSAENSQSNSKRSGWHMLGFGKEDKQSRPLNRTQSGADSAMKRIDRLITHQTLSNHEVAEQLRIIAMDKRIPEKARAEALGHGVILELAIFTDMAADTQLPEEMAATLLQHIINANQDRALQIRAYTEFLNHPSPEIRDEAKQLLAFILEEDSGEADEATLRQMADAKLEQLAAEKPPEQ
ncbi:MAG: hypothetical protein V4727_08415 [Verrucomicrobiota bacterium]